ncbi:nucleoredoxin-like protein 2 [Diabrotica undecimpunctata]|uniref:nucleoredoxin-like protein 2 n=1 Tax=Diabrotica undecimpunctata TaxID=50387 RepID=UPI003B632919
MDILEDQMIKKPDGTVVEWHVYLKNVKIFIFFFSASCVKNAEELIRLLKELYAENLKKNIGMEIIYVSADTTLESYEEGIAEQGPWCAIPFENDISVELRYRYDVTSMPQLVVVKKDGTIISAKVNNNSSQTPPYVSVVKSTPKSYFPNKNQAIVMHAAENLKLFDYVNAADDAVGP